MSASTPRERARSYALRSATNPHGVWGRDSVRDMLEDAWLSGYRSCSRKRKLDREPRRVAVDRAIADQFIGTDVGPEGEST